MSKPDMSHVDRFISRPDEIEVELYNDVDGLEEDEDSDLEEEEDE